MNHRNRAANRDSVCDYAILLSLVSVSKIVEKDVTEKVYFYLRKIRSNEELKFSC